MSEIIRKEIESTEGRYFITTAGTVEDKNREEIKLPVVSGYKVFSGAKFTGEVRGINFL